MRASLLGPFLMVAAAPAMAEPAVRLYAAGSLAGALGEAAHIFTATTGTEVATTFGPSGLMRERIEDGEPATLFASADLVHPRRLAAEGKAGPVVLFARNRVCAVVRPDIEVSAESLAATMRDPAIKLGVAATKVDPLGDYTWQLFAKAEAVEAGAAGVLEAKAIVLSGGRDTAKPPPGRNVVVWHIEEGRADLFLAYCSGAAEAVTQMPALRVVQPAASLAVGAEYGLTVLKGVAAQEASAAAFAMFILSDKGQAILARHGLLPVAAPAG